MNNSVIKNNIVEWLNTISDVFTYKIIDGQYVLQKSINFIKKDNISFHDKCCICLEDANCLTNCNHEICITCVNHLNEYKCPLCRQMFNACYITND